MNYLPSFEIVSFYTGVMSLCLGIISFIASIFFYDKAKKSENENIKILNDISSATNILNSITNKMLEKTIGYIASSNEQLINKLSMHKVSLPPTKINGHDSYILLAYSYIVRTNFLAKACYVKVSCTKTKSSLQKIIDSSRSDYDIVCIDIKKIDEVKLKGSPIYDMYLSDKNFYGEMIDLDVSKK